MVNEARVRDAIVSWQGALDAAHGQMRQALTSPADRHADLLARFQVRPDGTTMWPSGVTAWLAEQAGFNPKKVTLAEAAMLDGLLGQRGFGGVKRFNDIMQDALHVSEGRFEGKGGTDGHADAFRHAYWNALMTQDYGEPWAADFATSHERNPASNPIAVAMDLHNNEVGREIARANPNASPEQFAGLVEQAVRDGRMVVIDQNDTLVPSNEVLPGGTRDTANKPWSENNPDRADDRDPGPPSAPLAPGPHSLGGRRGG